MSVRVARSYVGAYRRTHLPLGKVVLYFGLTIGALFTLIPYLWMLGSSLRPPNEMFTVGLELFPSQPTLINYQHALQRDPLLRFLLNSGIMAVGETTGVLITSVMAGYSFGRLRFWGRDILFLMVLGTMMIPSQVTLIPTFIIMRWLGWVNTYQGLIVPRVVSAFGVFLMRQFFLSLPHELEDAARVDGCGRFRVLWQILLPLITPALATLAIFTFNNSWNEFFWPLVIVSNGDMRTIQVAIASLHGEDVDWGQVMAASTLAALPVITLYLALQRYFVRGIVMSGLKG